MGIDGLVSWSLVLKVCSIFWASVYVELHISVRHGYDVVVIDTSRSFGVDFLYREMSIRYPF